MKSFIEFKNGRPLINIDGELHYPLAYTTYFDECGEFGEFAKSGYRMFFVNTSFTDLPINNVSGFTPTRVGIFEKETPDYSEFDSTVAKILDVCPEAFIFPRITVSMPRKWINENPDETVDTPSGKRESLLSDKYLRDGAVLLKEFVDHIQNADYAHRIAGYQLCGGTTQEWMHHDLFGSFSQKSLKKFSEWMYIKYGIKNAELPQKEDFSNGKYNEAASRYGEFSCEMAAKTIEHFAKELKEYINNDKIVGTFYGYNAFVDNYMLGLHGLRHIISSPYIDFFSSPCCYDNNRHLGIDWGDMIPVDSVKLHQKMCFIECDIRTHLTKRMQDSRPGEYPDDILLLTDKNGNKTVWSGPDTPELSLSAIRKAFIHQLTKGSGIWWFDMWGGWYHDSKIMAELEKMKSIANSAENKNSEDFPAPETVLFIDETAYLNLPRHNYLNGTVNNIRNAMGNTGIPFDMFMIEDAEKIIHKYRVAIFTAPLPSQAGKAAVEMCKKAKIPYLHSTEKKPFFTAEELRDFLVFNGVHCYNAEGNVIYSNGGHIGIHSVKDGEVKIKLPKEYTVKPLLGTEFSEQKADEILIEMTKHNTAIFELM